MTVNGEITERGLPVQKLAEGVRRLVLDQRLQKHPTEDKNVKEKLPRQLLALRMLAQVINIFTC